VTMSSSSHHSLHKLDAMLDTDDDRLDDVQELIEDRLEGLELTEEHVETKEIRLDGLMLEEEPDDA